MKAKIATVLAYVILFGIGVYLINIYMSGSAVDMTIAKDHPWRSLAVFGMWVSFLFLDAFFCFLVCGIPWDLFGDPTLD